MAASKAAGSGETAKKPRKISENSLKNLRPWTHEDQKTGGKAAAAAVKRKTAYKELIREIGTIEAPDVIRQSMIDLGLPDDQTTLNAAMIYGQFMGAINGDSRCATFIRDTAGQMPVKQLEITDNRDDISLYDRLLQASQAALDVKQRAFVQIPISPPDVIDVELAPDDS